MRPWAVEEVREFKSENVLQKSGFLHCWGWPPPWIHCLEYSDMVWHRISLLSLTALHMSDMQMWLKEVTFTTSKQSANATLFKNPSQNVCRHGHETHTWTKRRVRVRRHTVRQRFPQLYLKVNKVKQNKRLEEFKWLNRTKGTEKKIKWKQSKTNQANYVTTVINQELKKNEVNKGNERAETTTWPKNDSQQHQFWVFLNVSRGCGVFGGVQPRVSGPKSQPTNKRVF